MKTWADLERYDLRMIPLMEAAGWTVDFHRRDYSLGKIKPENPPLWPVHFNKGNESIWNWDKAKGEWVYAEIKEGTWTNKKPFNSLEEFLKTQA